MTNKFSPTEHDIGFVAGLELVIGYLRTNKRVALNRKALIKYLEGRVDRLTENWDREEQP